VTDDAEPAESNGHPESTGPAQNAADAGYAFGAAGRRAHAFFADRPADQARELLDELAGLSRSARSAENSGRP
jgi:hypothetical protein